MNKPRFIHITKTGGRSIIETCRNAIFIPKGNHPHHAAELHLKTSQFDLHAHDEGTDMYVTIDNTIDKMVTLVTKQKKINIDKQRKTNTEKRSFTDSEDKYTLS